MRLTYDEREIRDATSMLLARAVLSYASPSFAEIEAIAADFHRRMLESGLAVTRIKPPRVGPEGPDEVDRAREVSNG